MICYGTKRGKTMHMSLIQGGIFSQDAAIYCTAQWTKLASTADAHPAGQGTIGEDANMPVGSLGFVLSDVPMVGDGVMASHRLDMPANAGQVLVRLDEVCFPVGAVAHRHTHCGPGIRHLVRGSLRIEADDHTQVMQAGDSWFEAAQSPVRAVAMQRQGVTSFVRCMVLPVDWQGKSTFALMDAKDGQLPRLQVTHRHIDHILQLDAG